MSHTTLCAIALISGILAGVLAVTLATLIWYAGYASGKLDLPASLLLTVVSAVCLASLRPTRWARKHGNRPGSHRR